MFSAAAGPPNINVCFICFDEDIGKAGPLMMNYSSVVKKVEILMGIFKQGSASDKTFGRTSNESGIKTTAASISTARKRRGGLTAGFGSHGKVISAKR